MEMKHNPYPKRPYPVGALSYELEDRHLKNINPFRHIALLEFGEAEVLYDIPRIIGGGTIANLGHSRGGSAVLMAMCLRELELDGHVYSVDIFLRSGKLSPSYNQAINIMDQFDVADKITLCHGTTDEWAEKLGGETFDFLFIDADHSYAAVLRDLQNWAPLVRTNGLVGFHDTNQEFSHRVLEEEMLDSPCWAECEELHINRIRVFKKIQNDCIKGV